MKKTVIIGGGIAGFTAGIYARQSGSMPSCGYFQKSGRRLMGKSR